MDIAQLREEYMGESLDETDVARDPILQFQAWFDEAVRGALPMVNAMTLATVSRAGRPSARMVLLKGVDPTGFVFYTDYRSRKGQDLSVNPCAALLFYWIELEREVRVEGTVVKTTPAESDTYFRSRPLGSRLAAIASVQSTVVPDRRFLEARYAEIETRFGGAPARPATWGGYKVVPETIEFWQGRANRLHDRLLYSKTAEGSWAITRLSP
jgi:pyridoxamine 5'-phosphate oxidase